MTKQHKYTEEQREFIKNNVKGTLIPDLTKNGSFFASRRDNGLRQTWKEEHLKFVPEIYRQFAVEFDEDKEY